MKLSDIFKDYMDVDIPEDKVDEVLGAASQYFKKEEGTPDTLVNRLNTKFSQETPAGVRYPELYIAQYAAIETFQFIMAHLDEKPGAANMWIIRDMMNDFMCNIRDMAGMDAVEPDDYVPFDPDAYRIGRFIMKIGHNNLAKIFDEPILRYLEPKFNDVSRQTQLLKMLCKHQDDKAARGVPSNPFVNGIYISADELSKYDADDVRALHLMTELLRRGGHARNWDKVFAVYDDKMMEFVSRVLKLPTKVRNWLMEEVERLTTVRKGNIPNLTVGDVSDGYHTFNQLYEHRTALFAGIWHMFKDDAWISKRHHDANFAMFDGMFLAGIQTPYGQVSYHCENEYWPYFDPKKEVLCPPEFDGHTPDDVSRRLRMTCANRTATVVKSNEGGYTTEQLADAVVESVVRLVYVSDKAPTESNWDIMIDCLCSNSVSAQDIISSILRVKEKYPDRWLFAGNLGSLSARVEESCAIWCSKHDVNNNAE